jgi:predicted pyridoxine 5'-phosphate oxidase superfamily flavin-nucleotide-binding protein
MNKTRQNIAENPVAAMTYWSIDDHYGYQIKGSTRVETSGELLDGAVQWLKEQGRPFTPKAVVIIQVEEAYYIGSYKDSGTNLI